MRYLPLLLASLWMGVAPLSAAAPTMEAEALGFSAKLPTEWALADIPGNEYRVGTGPTEGDFRVNILLKSKDHPGNLDAFSEEAIRDLRQSLPGYRQIDVSDFKTDEGLVLKKLIAESQLGQPSWQAFYFGPAANGQFFTLVGSAPIAKGRVYQNVFDDIARSIVIKELEKPAEQEGGEGDEKKE